MNSKGLKSHILCHFMTVCAQASSLGDDWSIHLKRGKIMDILLVPKISLLFGVPSAKFSNKWEARTGA